MEKPQTLLTFSTGTSILSKCLLILLTWTSSISWSIAQDIGSSSQAEEVYAKAKAFQKATKYDSACFYFQIAKIYYQKQARWESFIAAENGYLESSLDRKSEDKNTPEIYEALRSHLKFARSKLGSQHDHIATIHHIIGQCAYALDNLEEGITEINQALDIYQLNHGPHYLVAADVGVYLGIILRRNGEYQKSQAALKKANDAYIALGKQSKFSHAKVLMELAIVTEYLGDLNQAWDYHKEAIKIVEDTLGTESITVADYYINASTTQGAMGNFKESLKLSTKAAKILEIHDPQGVNLGTSYLNIGVEYYLRGYADEAEDYWFKALGIYEKAGVGLEQDKSICFANLAAVYNAKGDYEKSTGYNETALLLLEKSVGKDHPAYMYKHMNLAYDYQALGNFDNAERHALKALEISERVYGLQHQETADGYQILGGVFSARGDYQRAEKEFKKSQKIFAALHKNENNRDFYYLYRKIALNHFKQKSYDQALLNYRRAEQIAPFVYEEEDPIKGFNTEDVAICLQHLGQLDSALIYHQLALQQLNNKFNATDVSVNPAVDEVLIESGSLYAIKNKGHIYKTLYEQNQDEADLQRSLRSYQSALELMDEMRKNYTYQTSKQSLNAEFRNVFEGLLDAAFLQYDSYPSVENFELAFNIAEHSKSFSLLESFRDSEAKSFANIPDGLLATENELNVELTYAKQQLSGLRNDPNASPEELSKWQSQHFSLKQQLDSLIAHFETQYPEYYNLKYQKRDLASHEVQQQLLGPDQAMLEYFYGDSALYIFAITTEELALKKVHLGSGISDQITALRNAISTKGTLGEFQTNAYGLYTSLIKPVASLLVNKAITIIPDGQLHLIPFELLTKSSSETGTFANLDYLFKSHQTSYAYSANIMATTKAKDNVTSSSKFLAFAPDFNTSSSSRDTSMSLLASNDIVRGSLVALDGALLEVEAISRYLKGDFFQATEATEGRFKKYAQDYGVIHLATHAIVDHVNPMNSRLLFTINGDTTEDGDLYAWELYNMKLKAQMTVLSACNTGFGKLQKGEGIMSLGRAFFYSGCPSVVMSLWPAQDQATSDIMTYFYEGLSQGLAKDKALQEAKKRYLEHSGELFAHPFYWAGFVVQGDPSPLQTNQMSKWFWITFGLMALGVVSLGIFFYRKRVPA